MASDTSSASSEGSELRRGPRSDWERIDSEQGDRDRAARKHDEVHDPGKDFENAARPLGQDYYERRAQPREYSQRQREELWREFGKTPEQVEEARAKEAERRQAKTADDPPASRFAPDDTLPPDHVYNAVVRDVLGGRISADLGERMLQELEAHPRPAEEALVVSRDRGEPAAQADTDTPPQGTSDESSPHVRETSESEPTEQDLSPVEGASGKSGDASQDVDRTSISELESSDRPERGDSDRIPSNAPQERTELSGNEAEIKEAPVLSPERVNTSRNELPNGPEQRGDTAVKRPTHAEIYSEEGLLARDVSGMDERSTIAKRWMQENGWELSRNFTEAHVEAKVVVDMVQGRLPSNVAMVIDNTVCDSNDPEIVSCRSFAAETLYSHQSIRIYDMYGDSLLIKGTN